MKKSIIIAASLIFSLTSCQKFDGLLPDDSGNHSGFDDNGNSSSSSTSSVHISLNSVPQSVKDFVALKYAGYTIKEAEQELEHGAVQYKLTIIKGRNKIRLIFDASWKFLREKN